MAKAFRRTELSLYTTISEQLRRTREHRGLRLDECAQAVDIQKKYLQAIEDSKFELLPGETYTRSWIKKYAAFLGLDSTALMISYDKESLIRSKIKKETVQQQPSASRVWELITFKRLAIAAVILVVVGYMGFIMYQTLKPPHIVLNVPLGGFRTEKNSIILKGQTEQGAVVTINKQHITLDGTNSFEQDIALKDGLNTITIEARKKYSRPFKHDLPIIKTAPPTLGTTTTTGL